MAGEEDVELRDLVAQSLEAKGVLGKIRAQLRASVFLALEEQETQQGSHPLVNDSLQKFLRTKEGQIAAGLVREFLEFFELEFTCAVFDPETNALETYPGREQLARDVGLDPKTIASSSPLLSSVLQRAAAQTQPPTTQPPAPHPPPSTAASTTSGPSPLQTHSLPPVPTDTEPARTTAAITATAGGSFSHTTLATLSTVTSTASVTLPPPASQPPSTSGDSEARAKDLLDGKLNSNENSNLRTSDRPATHKEPLWLVTSGKPEDTAAVWAELGETFVNSSLDVDKLLGQTREGGGSSRDELDDFFDSTLPPSGLDFLSKGSGRASKGLRSVQDGGETTDSKPPGSLTSLRDAPALPGTAKPSLPPLDGQGALQLGFGLDMEKLIGTQGDYEEDFHSDGGSGSVSEHIEDPSHPLSGEKLETTDLTLSDSSLVGTGEFDHVEPVQTQP